MEAFERYCGVWYDFPGFTAREKYEEKRIYAAHASFFDITSKGWALADALY